MYKPKESLRWRPKIALPFNLEELCLKVVVDMLQKTSDSMKTQRNVKEKKAVRDFLSKNLPKALQLKVIEHAVERLTGVQTTLNLLDLFEPGLVARESVDLLGPFRMGFGSYEKEGRLTWSQGSAKKFNLNIQQLEQLYNIMMWSSPAKLEEISISVARDVIKRSKICNLLARAHSLTKVTILSGVENHTMRILGINCPNLTHLDVSHSIRVTDQGLQVLLRKRLPRRKRRRNCQPLTLPSGNLMTSGNTNFVEDMDPDEDDIETNPCASNLVCITLLGTSVTWEGCDLACKLMNFGYLHSFLPVVKILRIGQDCLQEKGVIVSEPIPDPSPLEALRREIAVCAQHALLTDNENDLVMDVYKPRRFERSQRYSDNNKSLIFVRKASSYMLSLHVKMDSSVITSLVLPWYTFTWRLDNIMDLDSLGTHFPNLRFLRARVKGTWHYSHVTLLPCLEEAYVWSLNSATGISILENAPAIKCLEFNNTQTLAEAPDEEEIMDETLEESLMKNEKLADCLEELTIRPADLSLASLYFLTSHCPNLRRIGDLESWDVTPDEIAHFNRYLDEVGSQCVVTVMNFPPTLRDKVEFI